jgi:hypothetical protein
MVADEWFMVKHIKLSDAVNMNDNVHSSRIGVIQRQIG